MLKLHDRALCGVARGETFRPFAIRGGGGVFSVQTIKYRHLALQYSMKINIL